MTNWISDWDVAGEPPFVIYPPKATNKYAKKAQSKYVYVSSKSPMSVGSLKEDRIYWGESIMYSEDIKDCELIYEKISDDKYQLIKDFRQKQISPQDLSGKRKTNLSVINEYRRSIMMKPLNDSDWSDEDLEIECQRLTRI